MKFGTLIEDSPNINHTKFGVFNSNSLAPPLVQICTHVCANNFWTVRARKKSSWKLNHLSKNLPKWMWRFSVFRPNLVCVMTTMIWGYLHSFSTVPPSGQEKWEKIFAYKFWMVWPKKDSVQHIEQYPIFPYWPFWALAILTKKSYVLQQHCCIVKKLIVSLQHHALKVLKSFGASPPCVQ